LILTAVALRVGMKISIHVHLTDKRAAAEVVHVDSDQPRHCGFELDEPRKCRVRRVVAQKRGQPFSSWPASLRESATPLPTSYKQVHHDRCELGGCRMLVSLCQS
jgi:hypothetical protein